MPRPAKESPSVAVVRAMAMLEAITQAPDGLTNAELSRQLEIPKSSASYILRVLEGRGYLHRDAQTSRYRLGLKLLALGHAVHVEDDLRRAARPVMRQLVQRTELTAHLAILDRGEAVYIERVESPGFIKMDTWVGRRMQVNSTSVGKALAAYLPESELEQILKQHGLRRRTPRTITTRAAFFKELAKTRARGYAVDDEENSLGARCVAVPVFGSSGEVQASLGVTGTTQQVTAANAAKIGELLKEAARRISQQMGR